MMIGCSGFLFICVSFALISCKPQSVESTDLSGTNQSTYIPPNQPMQLPIKNQMCFFSDETNAVDKAPPICIRVEVAETPEQQSLGLQNRANLPRAYGMWFPFEKPEPAVFWMGGTLIALDLIYVANNRVVQIDREAPACQKAPCRILETKVPVDGVLEIAGGTSDSLGIRLGMKSKLKPLKQ